MKEFKLAGKTVTIDEVDTIDHETTVLGQCSLALLKVELANKWKGEIIPNESKEQTLWHEIVHLILDDMLKYELSENEEFVQNFSNLLYQVIKTLK